VLEQLHAVLDDLPPQAAKTGALGDSAVVEALGKAAAEFRFPLVVDPVMISKHGAPLISEQARSAVRDSLLPHAKLVTPNLHEAAALTGLRVQTLEDMHRAAEALCNLGCQSALVKGGHLSGDAVDVLFLDGRTYELRSERIDTVHTHGTGCTYSAAITACLAKGMTLRAAVENAKEFITRAIRTSPELGGGSGPVNHFA
jgi:hydroxymethylpyrimidine/phosphomethylpyrimidine kinase